MTISIAQAPDGLRHLADVDGVRYEVLDLVIARGPDGARAYGLLRDWPQSVAGRLAERDATIRALEAQRDALREELHTLRATRALPAPAAAVRAVHDAPPPDAPYTVTDLRRDLPEGLRHLADVPATTPDAAPEPGEGRVVLPETPALRCPHCGLAASPVTGRAFTTAGSLANHAARCQKNPDRVRGGPGRGMKAVPPPLSGAPAAG